MVRRVTPAQFNSLMRQAQQKQKQAIDKLNRDIRAHNQRVTQAVNNYNRDVRAHNARVRSNQQRLRNEIARLSSSTTTTRYTTFRVSVSTVHTAYERLESAAHAGGLDERYNDILDLSEREAANNAGLMNALMGDATKREGEPNSLESTLTPALQKISPELGERWRGALFALSPHNPDAARHFCASSREIIARILDTRAPDGVVLTTMPKCDLTPQGSPTRRAKIRFFLHQKGMLQDELEDFVDSDMENIVELFRIFNDGTHGSAGTFDLAQLRMVRARVEDGITYLSRLIS